MKKNKKPAAGTQNYREYMRQVKREFIGTLCGLLAEEFRGDIICEGDRVFVNLGYGLAFKLKITGTDNRCKGDNKHDERAGDH